MEKELPKSVKLKLEQPPVICSGRKKIECYYRGKIIDETPDKSCWWIKVKIKGKERGLLFDKETGNCLTDNYQDIKIIQND